MNNQCTGNCKIVGFIIEYCETCGWDDGYTGDIDRYNPIKYNQTNTMSFSATTLDQYLVNLPRETKHALLLICSELDSAKDKHPEWPTCPIQRAAVIAEESGELIKAALQFTYESSGGINEMDEEAVQVGAMALRFILELDSLKTHSTLQLHPY